MGVVQEQVQRVRRLIPVRALPGLARRRVDKLWRDEEYRTAQEAHMAYLLEHTVRAPEIPQLAREYT
ncbi:MAG: hypothetical protein EOO67_13935, partial [Microbacterium sp.]